MIITICLVNIRHHNYTCFIFVMRISRFSLNNFQIRNPLLLTIVTMLYITYVWLIYLITGTLYLLTSFMNFIHLPPCFWQPPICSLYLWVLHFFKHSTYCCCCSATKPVQLFATPWTAAGQVSLPFTVSWSLLKLMSIESVMPPNHLILCHHLLLLSSIFSNISDFSNELALCIRWAKCWSFSSSTSVLPINIQGWFLLRLTGLLSLLSRDSQESSPAPQFESINSLTLCFLCGPTLTTVYD